MRPPEEVHFDPALAVVKPEGAFIEGLHRRFGGRRIHGGDVRTPTGGSLPTGWLVALHLFREADVGDGRGARLSPFGAAITVVSVMMRDEDVLHGFGGDCLDGIHDQMRAAR